LKAKRRREFIGPVKVGRGVTPDDENRRGDD